VLWAGLVAFALALASYVVFEPSLLTLVTSVSEVAIIIVVFCVICLSEITG